MPHFTHIRPEMRDIYPAYRFFFFFFRGGFFTDRRRDTGDLAAPGRSHGIGWENNEQTKLTIEPNPKDIVATRSSGPIKLEVLKSCYKATDAVAASKRTGVLLTTLTFQ